MKKDELTNINIALKDFPAKLAKPFKVLMDAKNVSEKISARSYLVKMGKAIMPQLQQLTDYENSEIRMEAAKIIELIADGKSIPIFIKLLDDKEFEIRWIAAEGLIKIGRNSIRPLLMSVRDGESSLIYNKGVHHVLESLLNGVEKKKLVTLLRSLDDYHELGETAPVEASVALKTVFKTRE